MQTTPDISPQRYYKQSEAARLLGCDRHTLARREKAADPHKRLEPFTLRGFPGKWYLGKQLLRLVSPE